MKKQIKLFDPVIDSAEKKAILKVLNSRFWASGSGSGHVLKFENEFKKYTQSKSCVAVNSGTAALNLAFSLFDIKNKEVILPSLSFVSTAHCIVENGGIPVFVDIEPDTLCIDPVKIKQLISSKTVAILPVHFGGMACNLKEITKIAKSNKKIGSHSESVCFSFHPVKNLAMPTGGLISINHANHEKFKKLIVSRRWCGITDRKETDYDVKEIGNNYYMNEFSAAIGLAQLKKLDRLNRIRRNIAKKYSQEIKLKSKMPFDKNCSYHLYWILVKNREKFRKKLSENSIETGTHYKPIHLMSMYKKNTSLPITESVGKQIVTIPIHPNLKDFEIRKIIKCINEFS